MNPITRDMYAIVDTRRGRLLTPHDTAAEADITLFHPRTAPHIRHALQVRAVSVTIVLILLTAVPV